MSIKKGRLILLLVLFACLLSISAAQASTGDRVLGSFCDVPWGASLADAKKVMSQSPFKTQLQVEDVNFLAYYGEYDGSPAEFALAFGQYGLVYGIILLPDTADGAVFTRLSQTHREKYGPPDITRNNAAGINYIWKFSSSYNPPPDFAFISISKYKGSIIRNDQGARPSAFIYFADAELEQRYVANGKK